MFEIEIKVQISDKEEIRKKLLNLGAKEHIHLIQTDRYYNAPKLLRNFKVSDEALRIRSTQETLPNGKSILDKNHDVTYKGPKLDTKLKARIEHVCKIENPNVLENILLALSFQKVAEMIKHRQVFMLSYENYELEILIDEIEGLDSNYMEIEIMEDSQSKQEKAKEILIKFIEFIGYTTKDSILESYLEMYLNKHSSG